MTVDLASMIASDIKAGPGADFGKTVTFEKMNRPKHAAFTLNNVPVSGIPLAETGKIDGDLDVWPCTVLATVSECPYQPEVGQSVSVTGGPRCSIETVQKDPTGAFYAITVEAEVNG